MAHGNAVRGAQATKAMTLHDASEAFADRRARDIDELPLDEMVGGDFRAHLDQIVRAHAELGEFPLRLDLDGREKSAIGARQPLRLRLADATLQRRIAVLLC